ncbi:ImmA/IrrE family metallo-endopeptidase [Staphylococcus epidermidis]|nr:ImmA/IrrE family metallo-endopeptidase [Staphylococcus epidermidis]MCG2217246.1 ImmA/IrrE family metallo-endopeptidase [Staphylococcus epidermidis]
MEKNEEKVIQKAMDFRRSILGLRDDESISDFEQLVEKAGFFLLISSFPSEYDSQNEKGFLYSGENIEFIFINNSSYYCTQNFTVWHEVYHSIEGHDDFEFKNDNTKKLIEKEADLFAATILIPPEMLRVSLDKKIKENRIYISDIHKLAIEFNCHYEVAYMQIKRTFPRFYKSNKYFKNLYKSSDKFTYLKDEEIYKIKELRKNKNYYLSPKVVDILLNNYEKGIISEEKLEKIISKIKEVTNIEY